MSMACKCSQKKDKSKLCILRSYFHVEKIYNDGEYIYKEVTNSFFKYILWKQSYDNTLYLYFYLEICQHFTFI